MLRIGHILWPTVHVQWFTEKPWSVLHKHVLSYMNHTWYAASSIPGFLMQLLYRGHNPYSMVHRTFSRTQWPLDRWSMAHVVIMFYKNRLQDMSLFWQCWFDIACVCTRGKTLKMSQEITRGNETAADWYCHCSALTAWAYRQYFLRGWLALQLHDRDRERARGHI